MVNYSTILFKYLQKNTILKSPQVNVIPFQPPHPWHDGHPVTPTHFSHRFSPGQNPLKHRWPNPHWPNLVGNTAKLGVRANHQPVAAPVAQPGVRGTWSLSATHLTSRTFNRFDDLTNNGPVELCDDLRPTVSSSIFGMIYIYIIY